MYLDENNERKCRKFDYLYLQQFSNYNKIINHYKIVKFYSNTFKKNLIDNIFTFC